MKARPSASILPRVTAAADATADVAPAAAPLSGHETILMVEDDELVRQISVLTLERQGYHVLVARDGAEALARAQEYQGPIHLLITDMIMPRLSGQDLAAAMRTSFPHLRVLYISGYADQGLGAPRRWSIRTRSSSEAVHRHRPRRQGARSAGARARCPPRSTRAAARLVAACENRNAVQRGNHRGARAFTGRRTPQTGCRVRPWMVAVNCPRSHSPLIRRIRSMFSRIGRLVRGFFSLFITGLEEANPEALMAAARDDFRAKMVQYNMALARMAGVAERLKGQVKMKAARATDLERRVLANHSAGNMELAGSLARELQELKADLTTDTEELKETEEAYQANLRQAKLVQREFEEKVRKLEKQLSQVQIKEAQAEAAGALGNAAFKVGDLGDTMKDVENILQKRYETSAGKARVAKDLVDMDTVVEKENERKALEQNALAEFLASQGIQAAPAGAVHAGTEGNGTAVSEQPQAVSRRSAG